MKTINIDVVVDDSTMDECMYIDGVKRFEARDIWAHDIAREAQGRPIILVSHNMELDGKDWPESLCELAKLCAGEDSE